MRSAANLTLRNNRSFVPLCRVEKGCIGLQVLDGDSEMYLTGNTLQYLYQVQSTGWNVLNVGVARFIMHVPL